MSKPNIEHMSPLTPMQAGMLYHHLYDPQSSAYIQQQAHRLRDVKAEVLQEACALLFRRHEVFRTFMVWKKRETPIQIIRKTVTPPWREEDLSHLSKEAQRDRLKNFEREDIAKGFILDRAPLARITLFQLNDHEYQMYWTSHHIILDGLSLSLVIEEILALYARLLRGDHTPPPVPTPFRHFVAWQRKQNKDQAKQAWTTYLHGFSKPTVLPGMEHNLEKQLGDPTAKACQFVLSATKTGNLQSFARKHQLTLTNMIRGVFGGLLCRYNSRPEAVFGTVVSERPSVLKDAAKMIGLFINNLPMRVRYHPYQKASHWLKETQRAWLDVSEHTQTSLVDIHGWTDVPRDESLFQISLTIAPGEVNAREASDDILLTQGENYEYPFLLVVELGEAIRFRFNYQEDYVEADVIYAMAEKMMAVLGQITPHDDQSLHQWFDLEPTEQARYQKLNETKCMVEAAPTLIENFAMIVSKYPDHPALICDDQTLTFKGLDEQSNQLAHRLVKEGVKPGKPVGVFSERGMETIVTFLAIIKCGACYLPALNRRQPRDLIDYIIEDSQIEHLITWSKNRDRFTEKPDLRVIELDQYPSLIQDEQTTFAPVVFNSNQPAVLIYTSGSTGRPKGVVLPHHGIVNLVLANPEFHTGPGDHVIHTANLSFDLSIWEVWTALLGGARLVIFSQLVEEGVEPLAQLMAREKVTHGLVVTSMFHELANFATYLSSCRCLIAAGEVLDLNLVRPILDSNDKLNVYNSYAPTETTVINTKWRLPDSDRLEGRPSIGEPLANLRYYFLDYAANTVPTDIPGELFIGGESLALGYWRNPAMTARAFVPDPYAETPGSRMYATGDLGRLPSNLQIDFLGRMDHQVKIRGFRIELGEIESWLLRHPAVDEGAVKAVSTKIGGKVLAAWYSLKEGQAVSEEALSSFLGANLPDYMKPQLLIPMDTLPHLASGKINRKALTLNQTGDAAEQPRNDVEHGIATLWKEVFGLESIGIHDNFFNLGGHSMAAARLVTKIKQKFEVDIPIQQLMGKPTVAGFAEVVAAEKEGERTLQIKVTDLGEEVELDRAIWPPMEWVDYYEQPEQVLLTGATGFVGAFLLEALLRQTSAHVVCLVRADSVEQGMLRLRENMRKYLLNADLSRVEILLGDLAQPRWGLDLDRWTDLAERIQVIYHNGAFVHFLYPYETLKPANVGGTQEGLRLAVTGKLKPFHFISTMSVLRASEDYRKSPVMEDDLLEDWRRVNGGYQQSKWVSEGVVRIAQARGMPVSIYRVGRVTGDSRNGACDEGSFLMRSLQAFVQMGSAPDQGDDLDMTPADYMADAIVALSRQVDSSGLSFHIENPDKAMRHRKLVEWFKKYGYKIKITPQNRWLDQLIQVVEAGEENALRPLLPNFAGMAATRQSQNMQATAARLGLRNRPRAQYDQTNTQRGLAQTDIRCPAINDALLTTYVTYLIERGFLKPPHA